MKIIYKNVSQVIQTIIWSKVIKSAINTRGVLVAPCSEVADKTHVIAKIKILNNPTVFESCNCVFGRGTQSNINNLAGAYSPFVNTDLTIGAVTEIEGTFEVTDDAISEGYWTKFLLAGSDYEMNLELEKITYEVSYFLS